MYGFSDDEANEALSKVGSSYRVPSYTASQNMTTAAPQASAPAAVPSVQVDTAPVAPAQQSRPAAPPPQQEEEQKPSGLAKSGQDAANVLQHHQGESESDKGMRKLGTLVGTVLSFYTGNYKGGVDGAKQMGDDNQKNP